MAKKTRDESLNVQQFFFFLAAKGRDLGTSISLLIIKSESYKKISSRVIKEDPIPNLFL